MSVAIQSTILCQTTGVKQGIILAIYISFVYEWCIVYEGALAYSIDIHNRITMGKRIYEVKSLWMSL